jgi:hypothetical protein
VGGLVGSAAGGLVARSRPIGAPAGPGRRRLRWRDRVEVESQLELAGRCHPRARTRWAPALGSAGDARGRDVPALRYRPEPLDPLLGGLALHGRQTFDQRPELVLAEEPDDGVAVVVAQPRGRQVELDRQVADNRREVAPEEDLVAVLAELVAELRRRHLVEARQELVQRPELADELRSRLLADARDARDVVGRVALERLVVDHLVGTQPEPLVDLRDVVHHRVLDTGPGRHQPDAGRDELEHVEVDGDDRRLEVVVVVELPGDGADDVVGLVALLLVNRDAQRLDDLADLRELVPQVVRHLDASGLVVGVLLVAEGRAGKVERHGEVIRLEVLDAAQHDAGEPEDPVDELALRRRERRERVVAAVDQPVAVEQHQAFGGHERSVAGDSLALRRPRRSDGFCSTVNVPVWPSSMWQ